MCPSNGTLNLQREWMPRLRQKVCEGVLAEWLTKQDAERQSVPEKPSWHCQMPCVMISIISVPCPGWWVSRMLEDGALRCVQHKVWKVLKNIKKGCGKLYSDNSIQNRN